MNSIIGATVPRNIFGAVSALAGLLALTGCQSPDRVIFVTDTQIGVGVDAATSTSHVGFDRIEAYIGPAYPDTGYIPPVVASLQSDLAFLAPRVHQLYATGDAALIATRRKPAPDPMDRTGRWSDKKGRRLAIIGTQTHVGLIVQAKDENLVKFDFGYGRQEASMLPLRDSEKSGDDIYPSVVASISVDTSANPKAIGGPGGLKLSQFIATGGAAEMLAQSDDIRNSFGSIAGSSAKDAAVGAAKTLDLNETDYAALVSDGRRVAALQTTRVDSVIMKILVAPTEPDRALTDADRAKIRTFAARLTGTANDTTMPAGRANFLAGLARISDVRKQLGFDSDLLNALFELP